MFFRSLKMNSDSGDIPSNTKETPSDAIGPSTNYSRWMSDMAADIAGLKLHQLAIPGAHNSGVDMDGTWGLEEMYGACQNKTFPYQLAAGARYLDLRLADKSYWKLIGSGAPQRVFVEAFEFTHDSENYWLGSASAGRTLQYLVNEVKNFVESNPGEIVIIDFYHFKKNMSDSLERALPYLSPLKNLLIPNTAAAMTIGEIRQAHPGRSIILCFSHGNPDNWKPEWVQRNQLWSSVHRNWTVSDISEEGIEKLVIESMKSPPAGLWALSAAVYGITGPKHLSRDSAIRKETFKNGYQNSNIVMVDFIEREDTIASVTDLCIELNKLRAQDKSPPTIPTRLEIEHKGTPHQNTTFFKWTASTDNLGLRSYELFKDGALFATTNKPDYEKKDHPKLNAQYKVRSLDFMGNYSSFSPIVAYMPDTVAPTLPTHFRMRQYGYSAPYTVILIWSPSYDEAGVDGYELKINGKYHAFFKHVEGQMQINNVTGLDPSEKYIFELRAKDINSLHSEYVTLTRPPLTYRLENHKYIVFPTENGRVRATSKFTITPEINDPTQITYCRFSSLHYVQVIPGEPIVFTGAFYPAGGGTHTLDAIFTSENGDDEGTGTQYFEINRDLTPPQPPTDLKIKSRTSVSTIITWTHSPNSELESYAVSLDGAPPGLITATGSSYEFIGLPLDEVFLIEVWAINSRGVPSTSISITSTPGAPGTPRNFRFTPFIPNIDWDPPSGTVTGYKIVVTDSLGWSDHYTSDTPSLKPTLRALVHYHVRITAQNGAGESPPLKAFIPAIRPLAPGKPTNFRYVQESPFITGTLHWDKPTGNVSWYRIMLTGPGGGELDYQSPEPKLGTFLLPKTRYQVRIIAHNDVSGSPPLFAEITTL